MRSIGMDVHRSFAQVAIHEDGITAKSFRFELEHDTVVAFGKNLRTYDEVVLEATGNTAAIVRLLTPFVARVVIANPMQVKAIAHARVMTDMVDAAILAQLHAAGFLPKVWAADDDTLALKRFVSERVAVVRSIRRAKSRVHAVLHANLIPKYGGHLFGKGGRRWLCKAPLPKTERDLLGPPPRRAGLAERPPRVAGKGFDPLLVQRSAYAKADERGRFGDRHCGCGLHRRHQPLRLAREACQLLRLGTFDAAGGRPPHRLHF